MIQLLSDAFLHPPQRGMTDWCLRVLSGSHHVVHDNVRLLLFAPRCRGDELGIAGLDLAHKSEKVEKDPDSENTASKKVEEAHPIPAQVELVSAYDAQKEPKKIGNPNLFHFALLIALVPLIP
jgi:hypothetical protein